MTIKEKVLVGWFLVAVICIIGFFVVALVNAEVLVAVGIAISSVLTFIATKVIALIKGTAGPNPALPPTDEDTP